MKVISTKFYLFSIFGFLFGYIGIGLAFKHETPAAIVFLIIALATIMINGKLHVIDIRDYPAIVKEYYRKNGAEILHEIMASEVNEDIHSIYNPIYPANRIRFFFRDKLKIIAVDNSDQNCYVQDFENPVDAVMWLTRDIEVQSDEN